MGVNWRLFGRATIRQLNNEWASEALVIPACPVPRQDWNY
jgi:hypothetical protein